jgi:hypothetical protein
VSENDDGMLFALAINVKSAGDGKSRMTVSTIARDGKATKLGELVGPEGVIKCICAIYELGAKASSAGDAETSIGTFSTGLIAATPNDCERNVDDAMREVSEALRDAPRDIRKALELD